MSEISIPTDLFGRDHGKRRNIGEDSAVCGQAAAVIIPAGFLCRCVCVIVMYRGICVNGI